ncbi:hypothetical protein FAIPA1_50216 [Frankia sp. AiPs1]|uniref:toll/interleukin-1 receptor domain-containing protein n=1 Tax=Frankia sp. AiPa1 TaxID=573492 RepID=UPI0027E44BA6|nr:toll/interleukin-1 receptor domain-containing protein [Frankia sp. AiPa1]
MSDTGDLSTVAQWDFFVSYTGADSAWAEWIAWHLEAAGYSVLIQAWDFVPGSNWAVGMQQGVAGAQRTIALLSHAYLGSVYGQSEWRAALTADPHGFQRKLLPVRVEDCPRPGLLETVVSIDLFGQKADDARARLLEGVGHALAGRAKPTATPDFPSGHAALRALPEFPGSASTRPHAHGNASARNQGAAGPAGEASGREVSTWTGSTPRTTPTPPTTWRPPEIT